MTHSLNTILSKSSLGFIIISLCWAFPLLAKQEQSEANAPGEDQVSALVERLGDEDFTTRKQAFQNLEKMLADDDKAGDMLKKFEQHEDPEIATRVSALLKKQQEALLAQQKKAALLLALKKQNAKLTVLEKQADGVLRLDPADENMARSIDKDDAKHEIKMKITNQSKQAISISIICSHSHKKEGGGNRKNHFKKLDPGQTHKCAKTYENRYYVLADMDKKILGLYLTGDKDAKIVFRGAPEKP
jgi:hypothetical protein